MGRRKKLARAIALAIALVILAPAGSHEQAAPPPVPTPTPSPTPTPRPSPTPAVFSCSCSTPGQPVVWSGRLVAPNFFLARQFAMGQCLQALGAKPGSPYMTPPAAAFIGAAPTPVGPLFNPCMNCACN